MTKKSKMSDKGPKIDISYRCDNCTYCITERYNVQGDSGSNVYCKHPSFDKKRYIGDTAYNTPEFCPYRNKGIKEQLPNDIDLTKLSKLLAYSDRYQINIQFWPEQVVVFVEKNDVELCDYGGSFDFAVGSAIEYLDRINGKEREDLLTN